MKRCSTKQYVNDLEDYAGIISSCYLLNAADINLAELDELRAQLNSMCEKELSSHLSKDKTSFKSKPGFISEYYAPQDMNDIQKEENDTP